MWEIPNKCRWVGWFLPYDIKLCQQLRLCWLSQALSTALITVIPQLCRLSSSFWVLAFLSFFLFPSSFISISDLKHQQRAPCCSHLTWSTNTFKEWAHQGQGALPMHSSLPRAYLILFGYLTDGRQEDKDGCLYVKDNTGIIACEVCPWPEGVCVYFPFRGCIAEHCRFQMVCQSLYWENNAFL